MLLSGTFALGAYLFALLSELVLAAFFFQRKKRASSWRSIRLRPWGWLIVLMGLITAMLCCVWAFTGSASIVAALIVEGAVRQLKRFKDDVKEVSGGFECGVSIDGFDGIQVDDIIECYITEQIPS